MDILVEKLEQLGGCVLVQGVRELRNGGRHLETLAKDDFLTLEANVFGPLDEAGQVGLGTNVLTCTPINDATHQRRDERHTNTKVTGPGLEEGVFRGLDSFVGRARCGGGFLA